MKKTYIIPQMRVTKIQLHHMIAATGGDRLMNTTTDGYADADGTVLSRRRNEWDDEEEDF